MIMIQSERTKPLQQLECVYVHVQSDLITPQEHKEWICNISGVLAKCIDLTHGGLSIFNKNVVDWVEIREAFSLCSQAVRGESRCNCVDEFDAILRYTLAFRSVE